MNEKLNEKQCFERDIQEFQENQLKVKDIVTEFNEASDTMQRVQKKAQLGIQKQWREMQRLSAVSRGLLKEKELTIREFREFKKNLAEDAVFLKTLESNFPQKYSRLVTIFLGNVNFYIPTLSERFKFKTEYEMFKRNATITYLAVTLILIVLSILNFSTFVKKLLFPVHCYLVYFYVTITVRESILKAHGSNIKMWWSLHHYLSITNSIILLLWPYSEIYKSFLTFFLFFSFYTGFVQILQYYYQISQVYKLRALGQIRLEDTVNTDSTQIHWFPSMKFLLPFIIVGQFWQLINAYYLISKYLTTQNAEIHAFLSGICFLLMFIGNFVTTIYIIQEKFGKPKPSKKGISTAFSMNFINTKNEQKNGNSKIVNSDQSQQNPLEKPNVDNVIHRTKQEIQSSDDESTYSSVEDEDKKSNENSNEKSNENLNEKLNEKSNENLNENPNQILRNRNQK
ncbi:transmembrane protein induced by tumor necrosis factor alpha [Anaeramoeba ignava]|uniref:Transmembrane protein induced by tumor necrosis factor alpha n=1 Tax=Anaeramoeba ignava TaxID=1746090 RepID=A0A9Q0R5K4_ANAIG|nr:transmembrane protein induced by tumor necrosis factor alpha [Anaeramoeba ignava]